MKILFLYSHTHQGIKRYPASKRYFPWGPATVLKYLENDGHEIDVLDIYAEDLLRPEVEERLDNLDFECACIGTFASMNYSYVVWLTEQIKKRFNVPVIIGGILADYHYDILLTHDTVDICCLGEGENVVVDLFRNMDELSKVKGIAYRNKGHITVNERYPLIKNLDDLLMPNFDLWDMNKYINSNLWANDETTRYNEYPGDYPSMNALSPNMSIFCGRGCPYKCNFCATSYTSIRFKSIDRIMEEIIYFKKEYGIRAFHFWDELVVYSKKRILALCRAIKKHDIYWDCQARVNTIDEEILKAMKDANCYSIGLGIESGNNEMLKAMNKGITREQSLNVLRSAKDVGMHLKLQFMCGYPGETKETLADTVSLMKISGFPPRRILWCTPFPGSKLYVESQKKGLIGNEKEYLIKLAKAKNLPGRIILNVSGQSDQKMSYLYEWVHLKMEINYKIQELRESFAFNKVPAILRLYNKLIVLTVFKQRIKSMLLSGFKKDKALN
jgi:anaerobic magnesium-protoporphyrin IX monomethyl ester cyclase